MSRAYSQDLRDRVIGTALKEDLSERSAAARWGILVATGVVWVRRARETGMRAAEPRGYPKRSKLDAHRAAILSWIDEKDDIVIAEIRAPLTNGRGISGGVGTVWSFLDRCGLTFNKDRARRRAGQAGRPHRGAKQPLNRPTDHPFRTPHTPAPPQAHGEKH
jgi:transposase